MSEKIMCPGTEFETRVSNLSGDHLHRCTTCDRVLKTTRPHPVPGRNTASNDKTLGILFDNATPSVDVVLPFEVVFVDGEPHTKCPHCGELDSINEVDTAMRWNRLELSDDGESAVAHTGRYDFEGDGWICAGAGAGCLNRNITSPGDFEITDWI